jgi:2-phosphosulfolactate phosphatase
MQIAERHGLTGARGARGQVVVIDVLRAFTTAAYALAGGAARIVLVADPADSFALKQRWPDAVLAGEDGGRMIPGFDVGNSPEAVEAMDMAGRTVVLRSSSGTQGVVAAGDADQVFLGSLVVAEATVRALRGAGLATIVAMGHAGTGDGPEDVACQQLLAARLRGRDLDRPSLVAAVADSPAGRTARDPAVDYITPGDLARAVAIDRFDFAMPVVREDGLLVARAVTPRTTSPR